MSVQDFCAGGELHFREWTLVVKCLVSVVLAVLNTVIVLVATKSV